MLILYSNDSHAVLRERAGLVRADAAGGAQGLDGLQVLDEHVLGGHALGGDGQRYGDGGQQTLWHVGDDDSDQEYEVVDEGLAHDESQDEEGDAQRHGHDRNHVDEVVDLGGQGGQRHFSISHDLRDQSHECVVSNLDHEAFAGSGLDKGSLEHEVFGFESLVFDVFSESLELHGLSSQARVVYVEVGALDDSHVSWHTHTLH